MDVRQIREMGTYETGEPVRQKHTAIGKYAPPAEETEDYRQFWALFSAPEIEQLYIVGSFNSWMPIPLIKGVPSTVQSSPVRQAADTPSANFTSITYGAMAKGQDMPTPKLLGQAGGFGPASPVENIDSAKNLLNRSKFPVKSADPKEVEIHKLSLFMKPGRHHFYFVKKGKYFMLSQDFKIELYKQTNIRMNYVDVQARDWRLNAPLVNRDDEWAELCGESDEEEEIFDKAKSVFKNFKLDTEATLRRSFENDWKLAKMSKAVKDKEDLAKVKTLLSCLYQRLKNLWLAMVCDSAYPNFSFNDYSVWAQRCNFVSKEGVGLADLDTV